MSFIAFVDKKLFIELHSPTATLLETDFREGKQYSEHLNSLNYVIRSIMN